MIDWEVGSLDCWVALDGGKPFPITIYREKGEWKHKAHPPKPLNDKQNVELVGLVRERINDLKYLWKPNMGTRLKWDVDKHLGENTK
jgi:hypothetical protein